MGGKCGHGDLVPEEHSLEWFDRRDTFKDFEALQKIVLEPQLLASRSSMCDSGNGYDG